MTVGEDLLIILDHNLQRLLVHRNDPVYVACSGGADSAGLAGALVALRYQHLSIVYVDHGIRSAPERAAELQAVQSLATRLDVPLIVRCVSPGQIEREAAAGGGLEERARHHRYRLLVSAVPAGSVVVTAHHVDDQAETVVLRLRAGHAALEPLSMPQERVLEPEKGIRLVRPALSVPGTALKRWARRHQLPWIYDSSNADRRFRRNCLRYGVMVALKREDPTLPANIARFGTLLDKVRTRYQRRLPVGVFARGSWTISRDVLVALPPTAQELVLRHALYRLSAGHRVGTGAIRELQRRLSENENPCTRADIPVSGENLRFRIARESCTLEPVIVRYRQSGYLLPVTGPVYLRYAGGTIDLAGARSPGTTVSLLTAPGPCVVRAGRGGDRCRVRGSLQRLGKLAPRAEAGPQRGTPPAVVEDRRGVAAVFWGPRTWVLRDDAHGFPGGNSSGGTPVQVIISGKDET